MLSNSPNDLNLSAAQPSGEEGSALLIVFVFAAIVAIMLYKAVPSAIFEGERQKEQLLIDRGNEYKLAIRRFYARNKTYPTSLEQLDNYGNVRYLRKHYKDPITGKQEWRLIHIMGPGYILTDSKVTPLNNLNKNGQQTSNGFGNNNTSGGGFGNQNNSGGFGNSSAFNNSFGNSAQSASNNNQATDNQTTAPDPNTPPAPSAAQIYGAQQRRPSAMSATNPGAGEANGTGEQLDSLGRPIPEMPPAAQEAVNQPSAAQNNNGTQPINGANPGTAAPNDSNNPAAAAQNAVANTLRTQGVTTPTANSLTSTNGTQAGGNTIAAGAIAGVASTAKGSTIKTVDKQTDYSKWEFVYNPQKDNANAMQSALGNQNGQQNQNSNTGFGNPGGFGNPSSSSSSNTIQNNSQ